MQEPLLHKTTAPPKKSNRWIIYALLAGVGMGYGNYLISRMENQGSQSIAYIGFVVYFFLITYRISQMVKNKMYYGTFINYKKSNFFNEYREFKPLQIIALMGNGLTNLGSLVAIVYAFKYAEISGINQGVILTLNSIASVYNVIIFYLFFRERVTISQFIGIIFMMLCVTLLNLNGQSRPTSEEGVNKRYYAFVSLMCGMASPLFLSLKHLIIRLYKSKYNTWDMSMDGFILEYQLYIIFTIHYFFFTTDVTFNSRDLMLGSLGSIFLVFGKTAIAQSVAEGIAGAAASLANTQVLHMTFLTVVFSSQSLSVYEICGLLSGITGASVISMGDFILGRFRNKQSNK